MGFFIFSIVASSIYVLNDWQDCFADRLHPLKRNRPIASGLIEIKTAKWLFVLFSIVGLLFAACLSLHFFYVMILYFLLNVFYCLWLKKIAIVDIYCIALGFILRVVAGAQLIDVTLSVWILMCTGLLALFLALAKRRDDLIHHVDEAHRESVRGYNIIFIDTSIVITLSTLLIAYAIYTTLTMTELHLGTAHFYLTVPLVLFGILRYLQLTLVEEKSGSPTTLLYTDKILFFSVIVWMMMSTGLMYWR